MPAYCIEYILWSKTDGKWSSKTESQYCFSLIEAQNLASSLRWNNDVEEDTVYIRLLTEEEEKIVLPSM